jgi:LysM repeat protein
VSFAQAPEAVSLSPVDDAMPEVIICGFCDDPADQACRRCGTMYCRLHGDQLCDACADPRAGVPSSRLLKLASGTLVAGAIAAVVLLVTRPRLPVEHPPESGGVLPTAISTPAGGTTSGTQVPPSGSPTAAPGAPETYIVKAGDTLNAIAGQFGTTSDAIIAVNPGISPSSLQIGQSITIPAR